MSVSIKKTRSAPLLPEAGAGGAPLTAVISVISFLSALALAAFVLIALSADQWTDELSSSLTIQVKGEDRAAIDEGAKAVIALLAEEEGVIASRLIDSDEAMRLLRPWLGDTDLGALMAVPALVEVRAAPALLADTSALEARLAEVAPGAVLDNHSDWNRQLTAAARSGQLLAFTVFAIVLGAACAISAFAARAGLAANQDVVELLHLMGATDDFIAGQVQGRFLTIGLRGGLIGVAAAALSLFAAKQVAAVGKTAGFFVPELSAPPEVAAFMLVVPAAVCLVSAMTARHTVLETLKQQI